MAAWIGSRFSESHCSHRATSLLSTDGYHYAILKLSRNDARLCTGAVGCILVRALLVSVLLKCGISGSLGFVGILKQVVRNLPDWMDRNWVLLRHNFRDPHTRTQSKAIRVPGPEPYSPPEGQDAELTAGRL